MMAHPATTAIALFSFLSFLLCAFLWLSTKSACSGRKSDFIRGAVAPGSELGLRTEYVKGIVTMPTTVRTKKGKNCPCNPLAFGNISRNLTNLIIVRVVCRTHLECLLGLEDQRTGKTCAQVADRLCDLQKAMNCAAVELYEMKSQQSLWSERRW